MTTNLQPAEAAGLPSKKRHLFSMSSMQLQRNVRVLNRQGLHARPADLLVRCAANFQSTLLLQKGGEQVDCRSILSLLTLGATAGTDLSLTAEGIDAAEAIEAVGVLFENGFYENDFSEDAVNQETAANQHETNHPSP
jgi:phosphocarrier protein NPr/phosphocarrier protein